MSRNHCIDFIELPAQSSQTLAQAKQFYRSVFDWTFKDWGNDYVDTSSSGVASGINADPSHRPAQPLVVIYASDLPGAREKVLAAGGNITKDVFAFPGGKRFHFKDPAGNELAVWSDQSA